MIQFCSITTLPSKWRNYIRNKMSWENGGMNHYLCCNLPKCRLALNFKGQQLICWAMISFLDHEGNERPFVGAWTIERYRCKGYARKTIVALLNHIGFPLMGEINVYRTSIYRLLKKIGCIPILQKWDENKFKLLA